MEQFVVPQYIDVEDKIIGPITTRQFVIMLIALFADFIFYKLLTFWFFLLALMAFTDFAVILAFAKINGQGFHYFLLNVFQTFRRPRLRVWQHYISPDDLKLAAQGPPKPEPKVEINKERPTASRLSELTLLINTGGVYKPEE